MESVIEKSYRISGQTEAVNEAVEGLNVIAVEEIGKFSAAYVFDTQRVNAENIELSAVSLGDLFIKMIGGKENE